MESLGTLPKRDDEGDGRPRSVAIWSCCPRNPYGKAGNEEKKKEKKNLVRQISGQYNVSCKVQKSYWHFQIKKFCFCYLNQSKRLMSKYLL